MRAWALTLALVACKSAGSGPYERPSEGGRNTCRAQELNAEAAGLIASEPDEAERLLRAALTADIFFGPAHNNLGVLHLEAGRLYEAAEEFEWARKLMPGHPDPRMNLALTLEQAGKTDEAIRTYKTALEVWPGAQSASILLADELVRADRWSDAQRVMARMLAPDSRSVARPCWLHRSSWSASEAPS